tara:strand:+ start:2206 stop:2799 length:594 start_codon:yes stop_codon:yes gene_type:complete
MNKIGVLALQGSFNEHYNALLKLKLQNNLEIEPLLVRSINDLNQVNLLIIPGGESTVIRKLLIKSGLFELIKKRINKDLAVWGTCAGAILLSSNIISSTKDQSSFNGIDITIERNAYGAAQDSFESQIYIQEFGKEIPAVFIRAPKIRSVSDKVVIMAKTNNENIVAAYKDKCLVTTFHPELTNDLSFHEYFVKKFS